MFFLIPAITPSARLLAILGSAVLVFTDQSAARTARAIFIQPPAEAPAAAVLATAGQFIDVELPQRNLSAEVTLPDGDLSLLVLREKPLPDTAPDPAAPKVRIPAAWKRCLLIFFPDPSNKVFPVRVIPVNANPDNFPLGHTVIYNVSSASILGKFADKVIRIRPGDSARMEPPVKGPEDYLVAIDSIHKGDARPTAVCRSTWRHDPQARQLLFVTPPASGRVPRIWGILDRPSPASRR